MVRDVLIAPTFEAWQAAARDLLRDGVVPADVAWRDTAGGGAAVATAAEPSVQGALPGMAAATPPAARVPRKFVELAREVARHRDPERWALLYAHRVV